MTEVNIVLMDMPTKIKGYTIKNEDDSYCVCLNSRLAHNQLEKTYMHEIEHIEQEDFNKSCAQTIEAECRKNKLY